MYTVKRFALYILIILLVISIFQDLTINESMNIKNNTEKVVRSDEAYAIAHIKVLPGDTVLSIVESLNEDRISSFNTDEIIEHFKELNPTTDPFKLKPDTFYYFPLYQNQV